MINYFEMNASLQTALLPESTVQNMIKTTGLLQHLLQYRIRVNSLALHYNHLFAKQPFQSLDTFATARKAMPEKMREVTS